MMNLLLKLQKNQSQMKELILEGLITHLDLSPPATHTQAPSKTSNRRGANNLTLSSPEALLLQSNDFLASFLASVYSLTNICDISLNLVLRLILKILQLREGRLPDPEANILIFIIKKHFEKMIHNSQSLGLFINIIKLIKGDLGRIWSPCCLCLVKDWLGRIWAENKDLRHLRLACVQLKVLSFVDKEERDISNDLVVEMLFRILEEFKEPEDIEGVSEVLRSWIERSWMVYFRREEIVAAICENYKFLVFWDFKICQKEELVSRILTKIFNGETKREFTADQLMEIYRKFISWVHDEEKLKQKFHKLLQVSLNSATKAKQLRPNSRPRTALEDHRNSFDNHQATYTHLHEPALSQSIQIEREPIQILPRQSHKPERSYNARPDHPVITARGSASLRQLPYAELAKQSKTSILLMDPLPQSQKLRVEVNEQKIKNLNFGDEIGGRRPKSMRRDDPCEQLTHRAATCRNRDLPNAKNYFFGNQTTRSHLIAIEGNLRPEYNSYVPVSNPVGIAKVYGVPQNKKLDFYTDLIRRNEDTTQKIRRIGDRVQNCIQSAREIFSSSKKPTPAENPTTNEEINFEQRMSLRHPQVNRSGSHGVRRSSLAPDTLRYSKNKPKVDMQGTAPISTSLSTQRYSSLTTRLRRPSGLHEEPAVQAKVEDRIAEVLNQLREEEPKLEFQMSFNESSAPWGLDGQAPRASTSHIEANLGGNLPGRRSYNSRYPTEASKLTKPVLSPPEKSELLREAQKGSRVSLGTSNPFRPQLVASKVSPNNPNSDDVFAKFKGSAVAAPYTSIQIRSQIASKRHIGSFGPLKESGLSFGSKALPETSLYYNKTKGAPISRDQYFSLRNVNSSAPNHPNPRKDFKELLPAKKVIEEPEPEPSFTEQGSLHSMTLQSNPEQPEVISTSNRFPSEPKPSERDSPLYKTHRDPEFLIEENSTERITKKRRNLSNSADRPVHLYNDLEGDSQLPLRRDLFKRVEKHSESQILGTPAVLGEGDGAIAVPPVTLKEGLGEAKEAPECPEWRVGGAVQPEKPVFVDTKLVDFKHLEADPMAPDAIDDNKEGREFIRKHHESMIALKNPKERKIGPSIQSHVQQRIDDLEGKSRLRNKGFSVEDITTQLKNVEIDVADYKSDSEKSNDLDNIQMVKTRSPTRRVHEWTPNPYSPIQEDTSWLNKGPFANLSKGPYSRFERPGSAEERLWGRRKARQGQKGDDYGGQKILTIKELMTKFVAKNKELVNFELQFALENFLNHKKYKEKVINFFNNANLSSQEIRPNTLPWRQNQQYWLKNYYSDYKTQNFGELGGFDLKTKNGLYTTMIVSKAKKSVYSILDNRSRKMILSVKNFPKMIIKATTKCIKKRHMYRSPTKYSSHLIKSPNEDCPCLFFLNTRSQFLHYYDVYNRRHMNVFTVKDGSDSIATIRDYKIDRELVYILSELNIEVKRLDNYSTLWKINVIDSMLCLFIIGRGKLLLVPEFGNLLEVYDVETGGRKFIVFDKQIGDGKRAVVGATNMRQGAAENKNLACFMFEPEDYLYVVGNNYMTSEIDIAYELSNL